MANLLERHAQATQTAGALMTAAAPEREAATSARLRPHLPYHCTHHNADFDALTPAANLLVGRIAADCPATARCEGPAQ
jgi:hypothetical protein